MTRRQICWRSVASRVSSRTGGARLPLDRVRALNIGLLGDRVLQSTAWKLAEQLGWADTLTAEYLALAQLQADAFITGDADLAAVAATVVTVAPVSVLSAPGH